MTQFNRTEGIASGMVPGGAVAAGILREAEAWAGAQCELLSGVGAIWTDWLGRQREAIDASTRSLQQMLACRNPADIPQIQQEFLAGAARRSAADISALVDESVALTWRVAGADCFGWRGPSSPVRGTARPKSGDDAPVQRAAAE